MLNNQHNYNKLTVITLMINKQRKEVLHINKMEFIIMKTKIVILRIINIKEMNSKKIAE